MKWIVDNWFEITTAFVAVVALVQPWIAKWFHAKKSRIEIIPNRFFDIGFNKRGIYIILYATVISKHTESILSASKIKILKNNNCLYELESDIFMNPYIQSYSK